MIYYPVYEEQMDENDEVYGVIIGISIFEEDYICNDDYLGKVFHTSAGQQVNYFGEIRDLDTDYGYVEERASTTLSGAQKTLLKFAFHDFR